MTTKSEFDLHEIYAKQFDTFIREGKIRDAEKLTIERFEHIIANISDIDPYTHQMINTSWLHIGPTLGKYKREMSPWTRVWKVLEEYFIEMLKVYVDTSDSAAASYGLKIEKIEEVR
ncbi:MAG: hypothetical protein GDA39_02090 [Hyphomonadaceae bacterium]|nr:hypothetical protein [Hyphomonadaceae bacterium]MBC6411766.1 hypothetical protein [Hyphomonadaceae bacterium]